MESIPFKLSLVAQVYQTASWNLWFWKQKILPCATSTYGHILVFSSLCPCRQELTQELAFITRQWLIVLKMHTDHLNLGMVCSFKLINVLDWYIKHHKTHTGLTEKGVKLTPWFNIILLFKITVRGSCISPACTFNIWISPQVFLCTLPFSKWCCIFWVDKCLFQTQAHKWH